MSVLTATPPGNLTPEAANAPYHFDGQYIGGEWRAGNAGASLADRDPYSGAGMTHINDISVNDDPNTMFGGEKNSGLGRFGGEWFIAELTADHWISVQHTPRSYPFSA